MASNGMERRLSDDFSEAASPNRPFKLRFLVLLALGVLVLTMFWAQQENLEGEVLDLDSQDVIGGANVILFRYDGKPIDSVQTTPDGRFSFSIHQRQIYTVRIAKKGYYMRTFTGLDRVRRQGQAKPLRITVHRIVPSQNVLGVNGSKAGGQ
ncbi:MAG: carboxypeptidase regulatory-like domain-containing protein [Lewinellaceae bacterium]|nr:carboxypeptidase regulatory-like domain-containing protein [Lewinellaceae bacterium]